MPVWGIVYVSSSTMHDDDDSDGLGPFDAGKILHLGNPNQDRADYALPYGEAALQGGEPEFEDPNVKWSRRRILALGLGVGALVGSSAFWFLGSTSASAVEDKPTSHTKDSGLAKEDVEALRRWAGTLTAPDAFDRLVANHTTFTWLTAQHGAEDSVLQDGLVRLAKYAILHRGMKGYEIAREILRNYEFQAPPKFLESQWFGLEDLVREHRMNGK